jgi:pyoverdine/dityrosine biosynthesis protein Dit1/AcrR family transcriptional regulator
MSQPVGPAALPPTDGSGRRTRQRLLEAAAALLAGHGLVPDLLGQAAATAGCPPERAHVFFRRDEELVLALYARFAADLESRVLELPAGTVAERFHAVMRAKFALVAPYRPALAALSATLLDPRHELGALHPQTEIIRNRVQGVFAAAVEGATDRPTTAAAALTRTVYGAHLALMLLWCQDRSPDTATAAAALDIARDTLAFAVPFLAMPQAGPALARLDGIFRPLLEPAEDASLSERATAVLRSLFHHRRLSADAGPCATDPCPACLALHLPKVKYFLRANQPIHFVLPAFPAKSPSRRKVLGVLPDQAEELALLYLDQVCEELQALHSPGVRVTICSDGHVFSDLVGVGDQDVTRYGQEISALLGRLGCRALDTFGMADLYEGADYPGMRRHLVAEYAQPLEQIEERAHRFDHARALFNGIHRFLFEERADLQPERSRTQVRQECKRLAYEVIQRSDAWGRLLADCFPTALRLSIHPQHPHAEKIGILLGAADDAWLTPWHGVAVRHPAGWKLMKRQEAEALGAHLVERDGRPSHFEVEKL